MEDPQAVFDRLDDDVKKTCFITREGIMFQSIMAQRYLDALKDFEVRDDDVYIITYPKSGTTWMQNIISYILGDGDIQAVKDKHLVKRAPFLEISKTMKTELADTDIGLYEVANEMPSPRFLKTQLPQAFLPRQLLEKKPKIVYVARDPRDVAVSYYHFTVMSPNQPHYRSWDDFFDHFCNNLVPRGSIFDHVLFWWNKRNEDNVFFVTYEDMQKDLRDVVARVSKFLGKDFTDDVIDAIAQNTTFRAMKVDPKGNPDFLFKASGFDLEEGTSFMRKGKVGDWKNHFTVEQTERFDKLYKEKMAGSGLEF